MTAPGVPRVPPENWIELAGRLGVPTLILVVSMFMLLPRIDQGLSTLDRVESTMTFMAARCGTVP